MRRRSQLALVALTLALLALWWRGQDRLDRLALESPDPVALQLLPPGSTVPRLMAIDGTPIPVSGFDSAGNRVSDWSVGQGTVRYRRGRHLESRPLTELMLDRDGAPRVDRRRYWLGTDRLGRDLASRLLAGGSRSLGIGILATVGAAWLAALFGLLASVAPDPVRWLANRLGDGLLSLPTLLVAAFLCAVLAPSPAGIAMILALTGWPAMARIVRGEIVTLLHSDLWLAARAGGAPPLFAAVRHLLPHALAALAVAAGLRFGPFLLMESSLSFLGFGVVPPYSSWGNMLADGREVLFQAWWVATLPGLFLGLAVLGINGALDRRRARREERFGRV